YWFDLGLIVSITGSQGKTTTTTLIGNIFDAAGKVAFVGGNIGFPYASFAASSMPKTWSILEISSFQLDRIDKFQPKVVVLTNITPNHLDRYSGFDEYAKAKLNILKNLNAQSLVIYNYDDEVLKEHFAKNKYKFKILNFSLKQDKNVNAFIKNKSVFVKIREEQHELIKIKNIKLKGPHNILNVMASGLTCISLGMTVKDCSKVYKNFSGLEHRLEWVDKINGVDYYNDSKCTTVSALKYSLQSFNRKIVLIAGGKDKGGSFVDIRSIIEKSVKAVILIGEAKDRIFTAWGGATLIHKANSFEEAMNIAKIEAEEGDVVLLSPACSSFDMFKNFENRGIAFKEIVKKFKEESNE
ncbi:MAG: UDP-N-acetylmuramoyl-L-alanine--D-glutamate ligase, partial [Calditrichia bacterium]|nr:UDP-N-acetylmuramoyl-L-alanine--D-glutamate ligase [Calditrichia bacterium]